MFPARTPARTGLACAALALCCALPAAAAPLQYRAVNQNLEQAKKLASSARYEEALEELANAEPLPGNTNRQLAELHALRAGCLLGLGPDGKPAPAERGPLAREALVQLLHVDPEGTALQAATEPARQLAAQLRTERTLLLHDRLVTVRSGRPIRVTLSTSAFSIPADTDKLVLDVSDSDNVVFFSRTYALTAGMSFPLTIVLVEGGATHPHIKVAPRLLLRSSIVGTGAGEADFQGGKTADLAIALSP